MNKNERRVEARWPERLPVRLVMWNKRGVARSEDTVTENLSRRGAAVLSSLPLEEGRYVHVSSPSSPRSLLAQVRAISDGDAERVCLHLEFVGGEWPLEVIH